MSGYKFYFHLLGSTGSQLDVAQPRALTLSLEEYTTINYSHFCPSVRVVMSSISLLHVPSSLSHFLAICVSSLDLDFSPSFSILSPSWPPLLPPWFASCVLWSSCSPYLHLFVSPPCFLFHPSLGFPPLLPIVWVYIAFQIFHTYLYPKKNA